MKYNNVILDGLKEKPAMNIVGLKTDCTTDESRNYHNITQLWQSFNTELPKINNRLNKDKWQKFGLYYGSTGKSFHYASCVPVSDFDESHNLLIQKIIPPLSYLQFTHTGTVKDLFLSIKAIYSEYIKPKQITPLSCLSIGFNHFEEYGKDFNWTNTDSKLKIFVPIDPNQLIEEIHKVDSRNLSLF